MFVFLAQLFCDLEVLVVVHKRFAVPRMTVQKKGSIVQHEIFCLDAPKQTIFFICHEITFLFRQNGSASFFGTVEGHIQLAEKSSVAKRFVGFVKIVEFLWINVCHCETKAAVAPFTVIMLTDVSVFSAEARMLRIGGRMHFASIFAGRRIFCFTAERISAALCIRHLPSRSSARIFSGILQGFSTPFCFVRLMPPDILYASPVR